MHEPLPGLDARHEHFLAAVVERYTKTASPVGSRALARQPGVSISPASIRGVFSELERQGLVMRPHASAGRVPTRMGYRYFVDRLLTERPLSEADRGEIVGLSVASCTRGGDVATELVTRFSPVVRQLTVALQRSGSSTTIVFAGARFIVEQPEFDRSTYLAPIFELLDERTTLGRSLGRMTSAGNHIEVQIGEEIGLVGVEACALVGVATVRDPLRAVGILGPARLDYPGVVSRLRALRDVLVSG